MRINQAQTIALLGEYLFCTGGARKLNKRLHTENKQATNLTKFTITDKKKNNNRKQQLFGAYLRHFSFQLLEVCMVFHVRLNFGIFRDSLELRCLRDRGSFGFGYVSAMWGKENETIITI